MNPLFAAVVGFALAQGAPQGMQPRVLMGDTSHCDAVMVRNGHIVVEEVCIKGSGNRKPPFHAEVTWDGQVATITDSDEEASAEWIRTHSLLPRLSTNHSSLYWDGKKVDLGKVSVSHVYLAFPWQGGVLIYGATVPRKGFFGSWPFKGPLFDTREMEPFCAIFFEPNTLKGEDHYITSFADLGFFVFPLPD
jgi:hypothetical protein